MNTAEGWDDIVDPYGLEKLFATPKHGELAVASLTWILDSIRESNELVGTGIELGIICAGYCGSYPSVGMRVPIGKNCAECRELVEMLISAHLKSTSTFDFLAFLMNDHRDWNAIYDELISSEK